MTETQTEAAAITILFSDVQGSTNLLERLGERFRELMDDHDQIMRTAVEVTGGRVVRTAGDSFFVVFPSAATAVECALAAQRGLTEHVWPADLPVLVRMGIHSGHPEPRGDDWLGLDVHRAARVMAVAHGGQVLLTDETRRALSTPVQLRDLGYHRLKDLPADEHVFQLVAPGLRDVFPPLRSLNRSNLPAPATPLIDRNPDTARALELLARSEVRLLSLLGPGGVGKTRLALDVAAEAATRYAHGVWLAALGAIRDPAVLMPELCRILSVEPRPGQPPEESLRDALRDRELLLVLDNLEHLTGIAGGIAELLAAAPGLDVLATSREALRIAGEHRLEVSPLAVEDARELFRQRADAVRPGLNLANGDGTAVESICRRLDGLPLALELAAARVAILTPRTLESRLAQVLDLPAGARDRPERQQTLRATIDWSYRLLEVDERRLLHRLAPFIGGARIESVEAIWSGPAAGAIEGLASLRDKSLLQVREDGDGEPRFWMLETIRAFAREAATAEGILDAAVDRHAEHYLALAEQAERQLRGADAGVWLERLDAELPNLGAALDHLSANAPERALRMTGALTEYWGVRGYVTEAHRRCTTILDLIGPDVAVAAEALLAAARIAWRVGEAGRADQLAHRAAALAHEAGDTATLALCVSTFAAIEHVQGRPEESDATLREATTLARESGDDWTLAFVLTGRAALASARGDALAARPLHVEALAIARRCGALRLIAVECCNLGELLLGLGEFAAAEALIDEALAQAGKIGYRALIAGALATRALLLLNRGEVDAAAAEVLSAIEPTAAADDRETAPILLSAAAVVATARGEPLRAAMLWAAAEQLFSQRGFQQPAMVARLREHWLPEARAEVPDADDWDEAWTSGAGLPVDQALIASAGVVATTELAGPDGPRQPVSAR